MSSPDESTDPPLENDKLLAEGPQGNCSLWPKCNFRFYTDWEGDPTIPRGTHSWAVAECRECGMELFEPFPDWLVKE